MVDAELGVNKDASTAACLTLGAAIMSGTFMTSLIASVAWNAGT
jgi:hypothetical protein